MEWFESPSRRMVMRLSVAVQLTDDLTGAPIRGSNARVWIEGQKPPIKKADGRSIFVDLPAGEYVLNAEGGIYSRTAVNCTVEEGRAENITIRLLPNRLYPVSSDAVRIEGRAEPGAVVRIYTADRSRAYKLLSDVEAGVRVIGIYHGEGVNIEGKLLKIIAPGEQGEFIRVISAESGDRSEYQLSAELSAAYPKIGTVIVPVSECIADDNGGIMLLLKSGSGSSEMICEMSGKAGIVQKKIDISGSNYIKVDLTE